MVTIIGSGIGEYDFSRIDVDLSKFDEIICDINFKEKAKKLKFKEAKEYIINNQDKNLAYIVTGSPFFFSATNVIIKYLKDYKIVDNTSTLDYISNKLLISKEKITSISLHGRDNIDLEKFLVNDYTLILADERSIDILKDFCKYVLDDLEITICQRLGYSDEMIYKYSGNKPKMPYTILVKKKSYVNEKKYFKDNDFLTENHMITKEYKRQLALNFLELKSNEIFWDVGAGSGSVGIEANKKFKTKTILFEIKKNRIDNIKKNLKNLFVYGVELYFGDVSYFLDIAKEPNKIFIGGGGVSAIRNIINKFYGKNILVVINIVTLINLTEVVNFLEDKNIEYDIISLSLTTYKTKLKMSEPQREIYYIKFIL